MKVLILSDLNSVHTKRWVKGLLRYDVTLFVYGLSKPQDSFYENLDGVSVYYSQFEIKYNDRGFKKLRYFKAVKYLRKIYKEIQPDIVHAHYATSYGSLGSFLKHQPFLISVWGSDIYDFPSSSFLHKLFLKRVLKKSTAIASTSKAMAEEMKKIYDHSKVYITPFGIDENFFAFKQKEKTEGNIIIGTVKTLEVKYGIDTLIRAFAILCKNHNNISLEITGKGTREKELRQLVVDLNIADKVTFHGWVEHDKVPEMLSRLDIYVALSNLDSESFGVAILEASSCGIPVVVSDADGPKEVVEDGITGFIVPRANPQKASEAIEKLLIDGEMRKKMGINGREHVVQNYTWEKSVDLMYEVYNELSPSKSSA